MFPHLPSTQDVVKDKAAQGALEGLVIEALVQTQGRGRHGRVWVSESGNAFFSFLLRPVCRAEAVGPMALLAGLAVARAVRALVRNPEDVILKWPNDVLLAGKKCAGILIEAELQGPDIVWLIVGVGLNVCLAPLDNTVAVQDFSAVPLARAACIGHILENFSELYTAWHRNGFDVIRKEWLALSLPLGAELSVKMGQHIMKGTFQGLDPAGNLLLCQEEGGIKTITAGEVFLSGAEGQGE